MSGKPVHTVPRDGGWANRREGSDRVSRVYPTQGEAAEAGRQTAINDRTEHIIHRPNGEIGRRNSYGNDPFPPRG